MAKWYDESGQDSGVVVSTRVRLARNLTGRPFPSRMSAEDRAAVIGEMRQVFDDVGGLAPGRYRVIPMETLTEADAVSMAERHLISPEFAAHRENRALALRDDEAVSVMILEEDHLRIQAMAPGFALEEAYAVADALDDELDRRLPYAFDEKLGFLTECPTNLGTALRASILLHLPLMEGSGSIQQLAATVAKIGLTVRGTYGEGSRVRGSLYQLSNQVTLGISEQAAIANLHTIAGQIVLQERQMRDAVRDDIRFQDRLWRAYGVLEHARTLTSDEATDLLSSLRLGVALGILPGPELSRVNALLCEVQPGTLQIRAGKSMDEAERDAARADLLGHALVRREE